MEDQYDFIEFLNEGFIAVRGHINFIQFKEAAEEYLNEDDDDDLYIIEDVRHMYGRVIIMENDEEIWSWGFGQEEENVVPITVAEYFSALSSSEEEPSETHVFWETFISPN